MSPEGVVELNALHGAIDYSFQFTGILYFAAFGKPVFGFLRTQPGGLAIVFIGTARLVDFHQKSLDHKFLHSAWLPEHALGMNVEMKMSRLDRAQRSGFFCSLTLRRLAVREPCIDGSFGECPLISAIGIHQQKFHSPSTHTEAHCSDL